MSHVLIVDDEENIRAGLREYAEFEGHSVVEACDGMEAVKICRDQDFDIIIMDVMMPKLDGFSACKEIKKTKDIPVLMLSARGEEYDKLFGFEMGIDDYVVKPFSPKEVMARLNVIVNRNKVNNKENSLGEKVKLGGLSINTSDRSVYVDGIKADLTPKEYDLLSYFVKNKDRICTSKEILKDVWGAGFYDDDRTVDTHINMLRNSIGKYKYYIVTLLGLGYKFQVI